MKQNFRTLTAILAATTIAVFTASCKKEYLDTTKLKNVGVERTINTSAGLPKTSDKAYLDYDDSRKVKWNDGDLLNINGISLAAEGIYNNEDSPRATFTGKVYAMQDASDNDVYWAVYPSTLAGTYNGSVPQEFTTNTFSYTIPDTQTYNLNNRSLEEYTYMAGRTSVAAGTNAFQFQMRNLGAVLRLYLKSATGVDDSRVSKIVFSCASRNLSGTFTVDANTNITDGTGSETLTVKLSDGTNPYIDIADGAYIYVILPPLASKDLTMKIYNTNGYMTKKEAASATLNRNYIYTNTISNITFSEYEIYYSVAADRKVLFSPGNLQWSAKNGGTTATTHRTATGTAAGTWRFAEKQWHIVGGKNNHSDNNNTTTDYGSVKDNSGTKCDNKKISSTYNGWIDLFGWGTSGYHNTADTYNKYYFPYSCTLTGVNSTYNENGYGPSSNISGINGNLEGTSANYDWGVFNDIYNPSTGQTDVHGTWRTPSKDEWVYLFSTRTTATVNGTANARYCLATVNSVPGIIVFSDKYIQPSGIAAPTRINEDGYGYATNSYSGDNWTAMEKAGCLFLPANGYRYCITSSGSVELWHIYEHVNYWSTTTYTSNIQRAYYLNITGLHVKANADDVKYFGGGVRLIKPYVE